jgi:O-antigen ligase/tetratricopeptide (TPR) repeat protein
MALVQAVVIALAALIITPGFLFYFDVTPKLLVLLTGTAMGLMVWRTHFYVPRRDSSRRMVWFGTLLLVTAVSLLLSAAVSRDPALSIFGTSWRRFGVISQLAILLFSWMVAANAAGRPDRAKVILRGISVAGALTALYGIAQYFGRDPFLPAAAYHVGEGIWTIVRPPGTLGYVSYLATWLLLAAFLNLALASLDDSKAWRRFAYAAAALSTAAMFLTGTRAAMLGLAVGGAVGLYRMGWRVTRRAAALSVLALLACIGFYLSPAGQNLRSRARWFREDPWGGARPALWRDSLRMAAARLPVGYGPEVFTATFPPFESAALARAYPDFSSESPHNIFLDALVSQGLPGCLLLAGLCGLALTSRPRESRFARPAAWLAAAAAAGIVAQFFAVFTLATALVFYVTVALAVSFTAPAVIPRRVPRIFPALAAAAGLALLYCAVRFTAADYVLACSRRAIEAGDFPAAAAQYSRYERWRFPGYAADLWYSRALMALMQKTPDPALRLRIFPASAAAALRATRTAEGPFDAWYNLAGVYALTNNARGAEKSLREAIAAHPNWFKPHWSLAQLLALENRPEEAEREAAQAADLNGGKHPEVLQTLRDIRAAHASLQR